MEANFLNFKKTEIDQQIFRVFTIPRLLEAFQDRQLTLVRPKKWDDPFENYIMNSTGELDGQPFDIHFREHFYGQCWSKTRESDALWRIYAPKKNGVRVTTTPRKLLSALYSQHREPTSRLTCFLGKVKYKKTKNLIKVLEDASELISDQSGKGQAQTLLFKRIAFKHENEVRLIFNSLGKVQEDIYKFSIDPLDLFDDLVFDPRLDYNEFKSHKEFFKNLGFKKRVVKSILYKIPNYKFTYRSPGG